MIMDATQPLSDAFDMIRKAFSPTVNANKMFFLIFTQLSWIIIGDYRDFMSTAVRIRPQYVHSINLWKVTVAHHLIVLLIKFLNFFVHSLT